MNKLIAAALLTASTTSVAGPDIDPNTITVSGISAGGYMAQQLHVAHSDIFSGAAIIAGGPHGCAAGNILTAMARCMGTEGAIPLDELKTTMAALEESGQISPLKNLKDDPVWLFRGTQDAVVAESVSNALAEQYRQLSDHVTATNTLEAAHHFPTKATGHACTESASPFIGNCDYDAAGKMLTHLYGPMTEPEGQPTGELTTRDIPNAEAAHLMPTAYQYTPKSCQAGQPCKLHVVLHGCAQSAQVLETRFIDETGYQPWANANGIVLLYPQVKSSPGNPYGCWDWWGYSGADHLTRDGAQMGAIVELVRQIAGIEAK